MAERHKTPIIADEIYADFVFPGNKFIQMASLTKEVPILSCGGLTKRSVTFQILQAEIVSVRRFHVRMSVLRCIRRLESVLLS